jgi:hypothetical protein
MTRPRVLIGLIGVTGSSLLASSVYACVGGCALLAARSERPLPVEKQQRHEQAQIQPSQTSATFLIWLFAVSGFVSIAYEVVWFRFLTNISSSSVYAFAACSAHTFSASNRGFAMRQVARTAQEPTGSLFALTQLGIGDCTLTPQYSAKAQHCIPRCPTSFRRWYRPERRCCWGMTSRSSSPAFWRCCCRRR